MKNRIAAKTLLAFGLLAAALSPHAVAAIPLGPNSNVQVGGFFSQGYLKTEGNNYPFPAGDGTFMFREMGFNASTTFGTHIRAGAQVFAQRLGDYGEDKALLDWAVLDYNFRQEIGVRVGRIKYPRGLYGEVLDLDVVRPFVFLPLTQYSPVLRDFSASFDGAMLYGSLNFGRVGTVDYKFFYGDIPVKPSQGVSDFMLNTGIYKTNPGITAMNVDYVTGGAIDWNTPLAGLKVHVDYSYLSNVNATGLFAFVPFPAEVVSGLKKYAFTTYGLEYTRGSWVFAAEYLKVGGKVFTLIPRAPVDYRYAGANSWYVSVARRLGTKWELGAYLTRIENAYPTPGTPTKQRQTDDYAVSVRYDVNEHLLFKLEWHQVNGEFNFINTPRNPNPRATRKDETTVFAAKTTLTF